MAKQIKGITRLNKQLGKIGELANEVRENLDADMKWYYDEPQEYQAGEEGQAFLCHMEYVECLLRDIKYGCPRPMALEL